jgi:hypothetical protein
MLEIVLRVPCGHSQSMAFSFPARRRLKRRLGEVTAQVEVSELALRYFVAAAESSGSTVQFVDVASSKHGVRVRMGAFREVAAQASRAHVATVYQEFERFLRELRVEHVRFFNEWDERDDKEALHDWTARCVYQTCEAKTKSPMPAVLQRIVDYYHCVRRVIVHPHLRDARPQRRHYERVEEVSELASSQERSSCRR